MMKDDKIYLQHINEAIDKIEDYVLNISHETFISRGMLQDAVIRQLGIIGESSRNLSENTREKTIDIEWSGIIGMRNRLIHAYFSIDIELVWEIIKNDLPKFKSAIKDLLKSY